MSRRLLILACSSTKRQLRAGETLPARELYDGPTWRVLRAHERQHGPVADRGVDVLALSAEHGLVDGGAQLEHYDRRMDRRRAVVLEPQVRLELLRTAGLTPGADGELDVDEVFVVAGAVYLPAVATALAALEQAGVQVTVAAGGIGYKLGALRVWLESQLELERRVDEAAVERGSELEAVRRQLADDPTITPAEAGELVEQAVAADEAAALEREQLDAEAELEASPPWDESTRDPATDRAAAHLRVLPTAELEAIRADVSHDPQLRALAGALLLQRRVDGEPDELELDDDRARRLELVREAARRARGAYLTAPDVVELPADEAGRDELDAAGAALGMCCNHDCRRFEYVVAIVAGDVEQARCPECEQLLVHESGLTWKDAAAAGYSGTRCAPTTQGERNRAEGQQDT